MKMTGGEAIIATMQSHGIDTIFALPGVQNDWFFNALHDAGDAFRTYHTRHEQGAGYMALGAAMSTGKPSVFSVVPGVGMLNASAALATAYSVNAPVFCYTGEIRSSMMGRGFGQLHELPDQLGILERLTKWAAHIGSVADAPWTVAEAFRQLQQGRPQPVAVQCPMDILADSAEIASIPGPLELRHPAVDEDKIAEAAKLLSAAKNPLIFVGGGAIGARESVKNLAELLQAPVISSRSGHGVLPSSHSLSLRPQAAYTLWERTDVVVALGSRVARPLLNWGTDSGLKIIRIDVDADEHFRTVRSDVGLVARCEEAVPLLLAAVEKSVDVRPSRAEEMDDVRAEADSQWAYLEPQLSYINAIRDVLPNDGFFVRDVTQIGYVSEYTMPIEEPRTFVSPGYQGTLGWGFATALGVKAANPDKPVIAACGDGGFMYTMPELATAVQQKLNIVTLVFTDGAFGNVQRMQKEDYGNRVIATNLHNPDFVKLAENFGALGLRATNPDDLRTAIETGLAADQPTLIEIPMGEVPSPWPLIMAPRLRGK